ncbi:protein LTV1 [Fistulifera solaris]|uniref:Protein LTV1 n=1 Tax=Fistulifera solaris TaxID=1519565 RepID=A0A1Z5K0X0_FISSO|nr:protein LTV1 [Fistulifera solaris]|eukprot:GAX19944.1 protein LTV1 [Fistulifera solaris]
MGKTKPFVDKKKSSTYHLLHRSQRDVASDILLQEGDLAAAGMVLWPSENNLATTNEAVLSSERDSSIMSTWRKRLEDAGLLEEDPERFLKPITGTGTFLNTAGRIGDARAPNDARALLKEDDTILEVERQFNSIPLTADCMDEDIAQALFGDFDENEFEELNDDFVLDAAQEPEDGETHDVFDYDEHINRLMAKAKLERRGDPAIPGTHAWGKQDNQFFSGMKPLHENDDEDSWDNEFGKNMGVAPSLSPEEEKVLCEQFEATLLEYDSDDLGDCPDEEIGGTRPLEGDAQFEATLDEFLNEKEDQVFMIGKREYLGGIKERGGSGFSALLGGRMVHAKYLNDLNPAEDDEPPTNVNQLLMEAQETLNRPPQQPPAEEILIDGKSYFSERERNPWDCESVLSTYSNLANNPVTIGPKVRRKKKSNTSVASLQEDEPVQHILLSQKTGLPLGVLPSRPVIDKFDETINSVNRGEARNKKESNEEKKTRKQAIKRERQMARIQKKATAEVFKEEFQKRAVDYGVDDVAGKTVFRYS